MYLRSISPNSYKPSRKYAPIPPEETDQSGGTTCYLAVVIGYELPRNARGGCHQFAETRVMASVPLGYILESDWREVGSDVFIDALHDTGMIKEVDGPLINGLYGITFEDITYAEARDIVQKAAAKAWQSRADCWRRCYREGDETCPGANQFRARLARRAVRHAA
jgi:hypothetical protein